MGEIVCYIKLDRNVEVETEAVYLKDIGSIRCADHTVSAKVKNIKVHKFTANNSTGESGKHADKGNSSHNKIKGKQRFEEKRCVISILKIIEMIEQTCPGVTVQSLGETEVLIEQIKVDKHKGWSQAIKVALVAVISFCGTAFTIMAYHNDIDINKVFTATYEIVIGTPPDGVSALEVAYSAGLSLGIILFFNHVGGRRLTKDPTPIEVEMRKYEADVNTTLVETAEREGKIVDVD